MRGSHSLIFPLFSAHYLPCVFCNHEIDYFNNQFSFSPSPLWLYMALFMAFEMTANRTVNNAVKWFEIPSLNRWETFLWCSFGTRFWLSVSLIESSFNEKTTTANENFLGLSVCLSSAGRNFRSALDANRKTIESSFSGILPKESSVTEPIHTIRHLIGLLVAANSKSAKPNSPSLNKQSIWTKMVRTFSLSPSKVSLENGVEMIGWVYEFRTRGSSKDQ